MRTMSKKKRKSVEDLEKTLAEFDKEFVVDSFAVPPAHAKAKWELAKRKRGRPVKGKGAKVISVSVEKALLSRSDALAKKLGLTRAALVDRGLHAVLVATGEE